MPQDIPNVYLTTTKTHPSNMFKSLSYLFYGLANFHLISDVTIDSPSLRLDDVDYEGDVGNKEEIIDWLKARTVSPPEESRFMFKAKVDPTFARIGHAEELFSPVPPTTHYWVVVTVPSADASTSVDGRTAVDIQVSGFDEVVTAARGAMRCGVFIDPTVTKPTIKTYPMGENGEEPPPHQVGRSHKNVAVAYEELVDSLPIKIYPITGNNGGVMTFLQVSRAKLCERSGTISNANERPAKSAPEGGNVLRVLKGASNKTSEWRIRKPVVPRSERARSRSYHETRSRKAHSEPVIPRNERARSRSYRETQHARERRILDLLVSIAFSDMAF